MNMSGDLDYDQKYFSTSELSLCAALICLNFSLDSLDKTNPKRAVFILKRNKGLDEAVSNFWRRKLLIEPIAFFEAQRYLKSRIYELAK